MPKMLADENPIAYPSLPPGWEVREYTNLRGRKNYACYVNGERVAFGIGTPEGAVRAAERAKGIARERRRVAAA